MEDKNILTVSHLYLFPGKELRRGGLIIHHSLKNLKRTGCEVKVVFLLPLSWGILKHFKFNWLDRTFLPYEIDEITIYPLFYIPRLGKFWSWLDQIQKLSAFNRIKKTYLKGAPVKYVYSQTLYPDGPIAKSIAEILEKPLVVNLRGSDVHSFSAKNPGIKKKSIEVLEFAEFTMAVSEKLKLIAKGIFEKDYVKKILYTICEIDIFKSEKPISKKLNRFLYVGAIFKNKGSYELIQSFNLILKEYPDSILTVVGTGTDEIPIRNLVKSYGIEKRVIFKGTVSKREELAEIINETDVFLFPSYNEGLPNAVVEAVACERVVICTDVGGVKEIVPESIVFNVIEPRTVNSIFSKIQKLKSENYEDLLKATKSNRRLILQRFSPDAQLKSFEVVHQLLEGK